MSRHRDHKPEKKGKPAKPGKRPGPGSTDWQEVERLYVQGEYRPSPDGGPSILHHLSYRELAERFGIRAATVAHRGADNGWPEKRTAFSQEVTAATHQRVVETVSAEVARYTQRTMEVGDALLEIVQARVNGERERLRRITRNAAQKASDAGSASPTASRGRGDAPGDAPGPEEDAEPLTTKELKDLADIHAKIVETRRKEFGLDDLISTRGKVTDTAAPVVNDYSMEVARAVVAARAEKNRTPPVTPGSATSGPAEG